VRRAELRLELVPQLPTDRRGERLGPELEALVLPVGRGAAALDDRLRQARVDALGVAAHVVHELRLRRLERDLRPALEVDAEVQAAHAERDDRNRDHAARDREPEPALAHEVDLEPAPVLLALRAHERRVLEPAEAGEQSQHRASREHGCDQRDRRTDEEHEREALDPRRRDEEQDERRDRGHDVRIDDRVEPLRIPGGDRGPYGFARTDLLFDAFEHDHVRVSCDSDREDEARESGQGQGHMEEEERRVQERGINAEPDDRDEAEEAVEDEQEQRDGDQPAEGGDLRLLEGVLAERR
jgi:hypothetical protein